MTGDLVSAPIYLLYEEADTHPTAIHATSSREALDIYAELTGGVLTRLTPQLDGSLNAVIHGGASPASAARGEARMPYSVSAVRITIFGRCP